MPRVELQIDNEWARIDSADYQMVGKWIADILHRYPIMPHTMIYLRVDPFFIPDPRGPEYQWISDWNADTRVMETWGISNAGSAADAARKLAGLMTKWADKLEPVEDAIPADDGPQDEVPA